MNFLIIFKDLTKAQQEVIYSYNGYIWENRIYSSTDHLDSLFNCSHLSDVEQEEVKKYIQERRR